MNDESPDSPLPSSPVQRRTRVVATAIVAMAGAGLWLGVASRSDSKPEAGAARPAVIFVPAHRGKDSAEFTLPASLQPLQEATLFARTTGYVQRWHVEMGDRVKAGQLLAEIAAPELDRELEQATANLAQIKAQLDLARITAGRYRSLQKDEAVSTQEVDEKAGALAAREADHAALSARVRQLRALESFRRVVAPFAGTITARNVEIGTLVTSGSSATWLYRLAQSDTLRVLVSVPQHQLPAVKPGTEADVVIPELGGKPVTATVVRNAGAFDPATRTMLTELRVANADGKVFPGMYGQVKFRVRYAGAPLMVPVNALLVGGEGTRVAIVDPNDAVRIRQVKLGRDHGKEVEILDGLADNDRVISNPRDNLEDGTRVQPMPAPKHEDKKPETKAADAGKAPVAATPAATAK